VQMAAPVAMPTMLPPVAAPRPTPADGFSAIGEGAGAAEARAEAARSQLLEIKSPMVGTFYSAAEPGAPPFVAPGQRVAKGQVVCIIEAMKIMNEIESEFDGVVREVLAENAHPVEYGQVLFRVDPAA
jgi:acetyl-CoA carboxylase biotin carboxyl carrier protein